MAACSLVEGALVEGDVPMADLPGVLAFAQVIEALGKPGPVLPMRFGSLVDEKTQVLDILRVREKEFQTLLEEVKGRVEMSIRLLPEKKDDPEGDWDLPSGRPGGCEPEVPPESEPESGKSYLARRGRHYGLKDLGRQVVHEKLVGLRKVFDGLFAKDFPENSSPGKSKMMSIHFLVQEEQVEKFQDTFLRFQGKSPDKLLLTGPWPPYHFATLRES